MREVIKTQAAEENRSQWLTITPSGQTIERSKYTVSYVIIANSKKEGNDWPCWGCWRLPVVSFFLGDSKQAIIIDVLLAAGIGLGLVNEFRAEGVSAALHSRAPHRPGTPRRHFTKREKIPGP
jgi:hypothetical protein